jgi:HAD superfamily hydrolase (TIGR01662 family)
VVTRAVLADLDGTLINSSLLTEARDRRRWRECVAHCGETSVFDGLIDAFTQLRDNDIRIAVVTSSVSYYAEAVLRHHKVPHDILVAYHDTRLHKPAPDPFVHAMRRLNADREMCVGVGDSVEDLRSLRAARVRAIAAGWNRDCHTCGDWDDAVFTASEFASLVNRILQR